MSIRMARAADHWRHAFARQYSVKYEYLEFKALLCLGDGSVTFRSGITAIVGGNGVGKSTLVTAIGELLAGAVSTSYFGSHVGIKGSKLSGRIVEEGKSLSRSAEEDEAGARVVKGEAVTAESAWLDPAYLSFCIRRQVVGDQNFPDLIEPVTPVKLDQDELNDLSYLVGKQYQACSIFEISEYAGFDRFPYFKVTSDGVGYGSEAMGQGELSLVLVFWVLRDLRRNSILVLEEPETHVSPRSQTALMNILAQHCDEKGIWAVITTHSPVVISRIPQDHIRLLVRDSDHIAILEHPTRHQLAAVLGGGEGFRGVILVEDEAARYLVIAILDELDPDLLRHFEIIPAGGVAGITAALKSFPKTRKWFSLAGVYDGDMRGMVNGEGAVWPVLFLPSDDSPEQLLRNQIERANGVDLLANELRKERAVVLPALDATIGLNPHDWLIECARHLGITFAELIRLMTRILLTDAVSLQSAREFIQELKNSYNAGG